MTVRVCKYSIPTEGGRPHPGLPRDSVLPTWGPGDTMRLRTRSWKKATMQAHPKMGHLRDCPADHPAPSITDTPTHPPPHRTHPLPIHTHRMCANRSHLRFKSQSTMIHQIGQSQRSRINQVAQCQRSRVTPDPALPKVDSNSPMGLISPACEPMLSESRCGLQGVVSTCLLRWPPPIHFDLIGKARPTSMYRVSTLLRYWSLKVI